MDAVGVLLSTPTFFFFLSFFLSFLFFLSYFKLTELARPDLRLALLQCKLQHAHVDLMMKHSRATQLTAFAS